jgi:hypothetical protein
VLAQQIADRSAETIENSKREQIWRHRSMTVERTGGRTNRNPPYALIDRSSSEGNGNPGSDMGRRVPAASRLWDLQCSILAGDALAHAEIGKRFYFGAEFCGVQREAQWDVPLPAG